VTPAADLANYVAQKFIKTAPPDLTALCRDLGLRIREVPANGFDGALVRSKAGQKGIVAVKASIREKSRKRFTIAHEIGHFVIPHHRNLGNICEDRKIESFDRHLNQPEIEANEFAAELLLPSALLRRRFNLAEFSLAQISAVAADFETSLTATTRSYLTLTDLPPSMLSLRLPLQHSGETGPLEPCGSQVARTAARPERLEKTEDCRAAREV